MPNPTAMGQKAAEKVNVKFVKTEQQFYRWSRAAKSILGRAHGVCTYKEAGRKTTGSSVLGFRVQV